MIRYNSPREVIKKEDGFLAYYFSAQIANLVVRALQRLPLKPNHYTAASLVLGLVAAWQFSHGDHTSLVWGVVILHISFIFDCCDGQVSRLKGLASKMGHWFDYHCDKLKDGALLLGLAYGIFAQSGETMWWIFIAAFITIFFQFLRNITALNRDIFHLENEGQKDKLHSPLAIATNQKSSQLLRTLKHTALFKLSDRVFLYTIIAIFNVAMEGIFLYAVLELLYATVSVIINYRTFHKFDENY